MRISTTADCCRSWCARAFAAGSWRRAERSTCAPTCCRMPEASRNPKSPPSTGATRRAGDPQVTPIYTQADAIASLQSFQPGRIRDLGRRDPGRARALLECRASARLGLDRNRVRRRRRSPDKPLRLLASGDIGPDAKLLQPDPEAPAGFDYVISESTYGDEDSRRDHAANNAVSAWPPRSATPRRPRAPCSFRPSPSNARRN